MKFSGSFGHWLRQRRKALDLTQAELADQLDCSAMTVRKIESGERRPSKQISELLADVLGIVPEERVAFVAFARRRLSSPPRQSLETLGAGSHKLPPQISPLIGRTDELDQISRQMDDPACRLLTLVGPGGIGKTRLAIEAAERQVAAFADSVYFVSLAPLNVPESIVPTIAEAVGVSFYPGSEPKQQLLDYVRNRNMLLVLDNFEHLLAGAGLIAELLAVAPGLKILATSREQLSLQEEWVRRIEGMDFPGSDKVQSVGTYGAVQLFAWRARQVRADFDLQAEQVYVIRICQLLDGMPLSILLAATWVTVLSPEEISHEIIRSFDFLETTMRDVPERQRSMRAVFDHSWSMLSDIERACLMKLAVFRGGFTRQGAQAVAGTSLRILAALVRKSLLRHGLNRRYEIHELLRQYAAEKLNTFSQDSDAAHNLHCTYYADFMQFEWGRLKSNHQSTALHEIEVEIDNLRAAWHYMINQHKVAELHRAAAGLFHFLDLRGRYREATDLARQAAEALRSDSSDGEAQIVLGQLVARQAWFAVSLGFPEKGKQLAEESLALLQDHDCPLDRLVALTSLLRASSYLLLTQDQYLELHQVAQVGLKFARDSGDQWYVAILLYWAGQYARFLHKYTKATQMGEEGLAIVQHLGDPWLIASLSGLLLGTIAYEAGNYLEARKRFEQGLSYFKETDQPWTIAVSYGHLGDVAVALGQFPEAERCYRQRLKIFVENGGQPWETLRTLFGIITVLEAQGRNERSVELLALYLQQDVGIKMHHDEAERLRVRLQNELPPEVFAELWEQGKALKLEQVLAELLDEKGTAQSQ